MATTTFYPDADPESTSVDGNAYRVNQATWAAARDTADAQGVVHSGTSGYIRVEEEFTSNFSGERAFFLFDSSALSGATVDSATLSVYVMATDDASGQGLLYSVVQCNPASNTTLAVGDFDAFTINGDTEGVDSRVACTTTSAYADFALNSSGLSWINASGISKLGMRHGDDIDNNDPPVGRQYFQFATAEATGTSTDPKLVVNYSEGGGAGGFASNINLLGVG